MSKMRKRLIILSAVLLGSIKFLSAQITFQKTFGGTNNDYGISVQQTTDGGYIIAGTTYSFGAGSEDIYVIKTNANGDSLWTKTFGRPFIDEVRCIQQTSDGGYIITASTQVINAGFYDILLIKIDNMGNLIWSKTYGGTSMEYSYSVQQTMDGGYIIGGATDSFGSGNYDVYVIKTNANGDSLWTKTFGGTSYDNGYNVRQTTDGGYIIIGITQSFGVGITDVYLIKTDSIGDSLWTKTFGGTGNDYSFSVLQTNDGGYIITGYTTSFGAGSDDVYLMKTDSNGDALWTKTFGGTNDDYGTSVQQTSDGGYVISGFTKSFGAGNSDAYLIKTDSNGNLLWTKTYGGASDDWGYSVQQTTDGGYVIAGYTPSFGAGYSDVYLIKTDSLGNNGCNQGNPATITGSPTTLVTIPATIVYSPPTIVTTPSIIVGSGSIVTTLCTSIGINEITKDNSLPVSPNPSSGNFIISFVTTIMRGTFEIVNALGEDVYTATIINEAKKKINLNNITGGIYFVKVFDGEKYYCKKIIIEQD